MLATPTFRGKAYHPRWRSKAYKDVVKGRKTRVLDTKDAEHFPHNLDHYTLK